MNQYIRVTVFPDYKKEKLEQTGDVTYTVYLRERAQNNMANKGVVRIIAEHFSLPIQNVTILTGHRSQKKLLKLTQG